MDDYTGPYVRTQGGHAVHKPGCQTLRRNARPEPWPQVDGKTPEQIREILAEVGVAYRWCRYCFGGMRGGS
jgi:hypothetical protein